MLCRYTACHHRKQGRLPTSLCRTEMRSGEAGAVDMLRLPRPLLAGLLPPADHTVADYEEENGGPKTSPCSCCSGETTPLPNRESTDCHHRPRARQPVLAAQAERGRKPPRRSVLLLGTKASAESSRRCRRIRGGHVAAAAIVGAGSTPRGIPAEVRGSRSDEAESRRWWPLVSPFPSGEGSTATANRWWRSSPLLRLEEAEQRVAAVPSPLLRFSPSKMVIVAQWRFLLPASLSSTANSSGQRVFFPAADGEDCQGRATAPLPRVSDGGWQRASGGGLSSARLQRSSSAALSLPCSISVPAATTGVTSI
nr:hypothetical protein Iba_chr03cCG5800 [Ipomoea batatas]